jgi:hypothetical protein
VTIPVVPVMVVIAVTISPKVAHTHAVSTSETITISFAFFRPQMRVTVLVTVIHIRPPMIVIISARAFNSIVKSAALDFVQLSRRSIPTAAIIAILDYGRIG